jgi:hypothetical protein
VLEMHAALGANALRALCDEDWDWATGLQSRAGETGHAFFHWPQGMDMRASAKNLAPGLCIRGDGDYVLVPPSMSAGISHVYCNPDAVIATAPQWLLQSPFSLWLSLLQPGNDSQQLLRSLLRSGSGITYLCRSPQPNQAHGAP